MNKEHLEENYRTRADIVSLADVLFILTPTLSSAG